jgi:hypothetical protein
VTLPVWAAVALGLATAVASGYLGARWAAEELRAELALRSSVVLFDMAGAVHGVAPDRLAAVVDREKARAERFLIGYDDQDCQCLPPHRWFLIDRHDRDITQGEIIAFAALGLGPHFQDGQIIIKRAAGVPGDRIQVDSETMRINRAKVDEGLALAGTLKRPPENFLRDDIVPPDHLWIMGATADTPALPHRQGPGDGQDPAREPGHYRGASRQPPRGRPGHLVPLPAWWERMYLIRIFAVS